MDPFAGSNRSVVARYLAGDVSLDSAASELAELWKELARAEGPEKQRMRSRLPGEAYELSDEDIPKLRALMERVEANLDLINEGARRYLKEPRTSSFDDVVRLLARDVARRSGLSKSRSYGTSPITRGNSRSAIQKASASRTFSSTSRTPSWTPHGPPARAIQTTHSTTWMVPGAVHATELLWRASASYLIAPGKVPPNKRLKLPGGGRSKGSRVCAPWRARMSVDHSCASERVARSLSAIR